MPAKIDLPVLTLRELNRALLARQMLLTRQRIGAVDAIERLACLQGQWAPSPYVALWSRLAGFTRADLTGPIDKGLVIKATLMRATLKRFFKEKDRVRLQPANGTMQPIYTRDIQIQGKVIGVIRRLA